jgi:hypothetical protein
LKPLGRRGGLVAKIGNWIDVGKGGVKAEYGFALQPECYYLLSDA